MKPAGSHSTRSYIDPLKIQDTQKKLKLRNSKLSTLQQTQQKKLSENTKILQ